MFFKQIKNLLPKKGMDGDAPKTSTFQHQLSRSRGSRKLTILPKITLGALAVLYFLGYQPTLAIPPIQQKITLAVATQQQNINTAALAQAFILPHPGYISTHFSPGHPGIDLATGLGMPIHPIADGKVVEVIYGFTGLGHHVIVEHAQGYRSTYGHMGRIFVHVGDTVTQASILGEVGLTGHTTGPHTHLEITKDGTYIDPETILPIAPDWPQSAGEAPQGQGEIEDAFVTPTPTPTETPKEPVEPLPKLNTLDLSILGTPQLQAKKTPLSNYFTF